MYVQHVSGMLGWGSSCSNGWWRMSQMLMFEDRGWKIICHHTPSLLACSGLFASQRLLLPFD